MMNRSQKIKSTIDIRNDIIFCGAIKINLWESLANNVNINNIIKINQIL